MTPVRSTGCRLGLTGYASILARIKQHPRTAEGACDGIVSSLNTARVILRKMHALQLVHIGRWRERPASQAGGFEALFVLGAGADAPYPGQRRKPIGARSNNVAPAMIAFASVMRALRRPSSLADLQQQTGLGHETLGALLKHCKALDLVHVARWRPSSGDGSPSALWLFGEGEDEPRPEPKPRELIERDRRERMRQRANFQRIQAAVTCLPFVRMEAA